MKRVVFLFLAVNLPFLAFAQRGPGDSIGFSYYDFLQSASANRNLINYGDGTLSFARMAAVDSVGWVTRGTYYKCFDGTSWSASWSPVESSRGGWGNIDRFDDGTEIVTSHNFHVTLFGRCDVDPWSSVPFNCIESIWMRVAVGSNSAAHVIGTQGPRVGYHRSTDGGGTWECDRYLVTEPGVIVDADSYDITTYENKVAFTVAGAGGDVVVLESTDEGDTWNETIIYDVDETGMTEGEQPPDGSCSAIYDVRGDLHVAWGSYEFDGTGAFIVAVNAPIRYWSEATGVEEIAWPDPDTSIAISGGRDGNFATGPDISIGFDGSIFVVFSRMISERDVNGKNYEHAFLVSNLCGTGWDEPVDITPGTGFDAAFPSVADWTDQNLHFTYTSDPFAGNFLQGNHGAVPVAYMYHIVTIPPCPLDAGEPGFDSPDRTELAQNYPNPFNPTTEIRYGLPSQARVRLKVYNMLGQEVATLMNDERPAGYHSVSWNGLNAAGSAVASGLYLYRLTAEGENGGSFTKIRKMLLLR